MCLAVPLKIKSVDGNTAVCESIGLTREVRIDFIADPQPGQYVIVHAGFAIERLSEEQALEDLVEWEALRDALN